MSLEKAVFPIFLNITLFLRKTILLIILGLSPFINHVSFKLAKYLEKPHRKK